MLLLRSRSRGGKVRTFFSPLAQLSEHRGTAHFYRPEVLEKAEREDPVAFRKQPIPDRQKDFLELIGVEARALVGALFAAGALEIFLTPSHVTVVVGDYHGWNKLEEVLCETEDQGPRSMHDLPEDGTDFLIREAVCEAQGLPLPLEYT